MASFLQRRDDIYVFGSYLQRMDSSVVEHLVYTQNVGGSIPSPFMDWNMLNINKTNNKDLLSDYNSFSFVSVIHIISSSNSEIWKARFGSLLHNFHSDDAPLGLYSGKYGLKSGSSRFSTSNTLKFGSDQVLEDPDKITDFVDSGTVDGYDSWFISDNTYLADGLRIGLLTKNSRVWQVYTRLWDRKPWRKQWPMYILPRKRISGPFSYVSHGLGDSKAFHNPSILDQKTFRGYKEEVFLSSSYLSYSNYWLDNGSRNIKYLDSSHLNKWKY